MTQTNLESYLLTQKFFADMQPEFVRFLARHAEERRLEQDHILFRHDAPARHFYLIRSGKICLEIPAISGPTLEVQHLGAGQVLGWSWLIPPYAWNFNARAEGPSEVIEFDGRPILARCDEDPVFGYELLKRFSSLMSERLDVARQKMMDQWNPPGFA